MDLEKIMTGQTDLLGNPALLKAIDQIVFVLNDVGDVVLVHPGDADWLSDELFVDRSFCSLFDPIEAEKVKSLIDQAVTTDRIPNLTLSLNPDHNIDWREAGLDQNRSFKFTFASDEAEQVFVLARDITDQKLMSHKLSQQAQRDPLTGAFNRRSLMTVLQHSVAQAQRYDWSCSVLMIDIDHFSDFNDREGLDAGDLLLQSFVTALHGFKRTADFFARFADDRFVMFLPETNLEQGMLAAERVRVLADDLEVPTPTGVLSFTVSIGVASLMSADDTPETLLKRAQENLFVAKQSGSNRIEGENE
jgi:diguanylate cyclase (GGDEF)-like protein